VPKLHQILAVAQGTKQRAQQAFTTFYHKVQKPEPFAGINRVYQPKDDEGEQLPSEYNRVQSDAKVLLQEVITQLAPMYNIVGDIDRTNMVAAASVIIDGKVILADAPVATLLWLEKQLADLRTVLAQLPTLDPQYTWSYDGARGQWTSPTLETTRSKKVLRNHVKAPATEKHPAQVDVYGEDVIVGKWSTQKLSGAMQPTEVRALQDRLEKLRDAVKDARERANTVEVERFEAAAVLTWLLDPK
jgi:hypothetical protein